MGQTRRGTRGSIKGPPRLGFWVRDGAGSRAGGVVADHGGRRWHHLDQTPGGRRAPRGVTTRLGEKVGEVRVR